MRANVLSKTTGQIVWILLDEGEESCMVEVGEVIASMESCKVEMPIVAPASGRCYFKVAPGQVVADGAVIAEIRDE